MTEPVKEFLPRGIVSEADELFVEFSKGIEEIVNFGTHLLKWDVDQAKGGEENLPIVMIFRHILELADSISILVKHSSIDPCKPLLRAILESLLGLEYLLEKEFEKRALGFLLWHYKDQLKLALKFKIGEVSNKELHKKLKGDKSFTDYVKMPSIKNIDIQIKSLEVLINMPQYSGAKAEYEKMVQKGSKNPKWYQLFEGPSNVDALATRLSRQGLYEVLYRAWSGPTHGTDIIQGKLTQGSDGQGQIIQMRNPKDAQLVTMYTFQLSLTVFLILLEKRIPNKKEEFKKWYPTVRQAYFQLANEELLIVH